MYAATAMMKQRTTSSKQTMWWRWYAWNVVSSKLLQVNFSHVFPCISHGVTTRGVTTFLIYAVLRLINHDLTYTCL